MCGFVHVKRLSLKIGTTLSTKLLMGMTIENLFNGITNKRGSKKRDILI